MKAKLSMILIALISSTFAMDKNCSDHTPDQVLQKLTSKNRKQVTINYSSDQTQLATKFQTALQQGGMGVTMKQIPGSEICNFSK